MILKKLELYYCGALDSFDGIDAIDEQVVQNLSFLKDGTIHLHGLIYNNINRIFRLQNITQITLCSLYEIIINLEDCLIAVAKNLRYLEKIKIKIDFHICNMQTSGATGGSGQFLSFSDEDYMEISNVIEFQNRKTKLTIKMHCKYKADPKEAS